MTTVVAYSVVVIGRFNVWFQLVKLFAIGVTWDFEHLTTKGNKACVVGCYIGPLWISVSWQR